MIKAQTYAQALFLAVSETNAKDHDRVLDNFVKILSDNGDLKLYGEIEEAFKKMEAESRGVKNAEIITAREVKPGKAFLEDLNRIVGSKVEFKHKVDEGLVGGVVIRVDDTLIDASLKSSLEGLRKAISK